MARITNNYLYQDTIEIEIGPKIELAKNAGFSITAWPAFVYDSYVLGDFREVITNANAEDFLKAHRKSRGN